MQKLVPFIELNTLGVINITPNSFSDQNKFQNPDRLRSTLKNFKSQKKLVLDFGFESTAPMNAAITLEEERERFDRFFTTIKDIDLSGCWISFDTYKPQNYLYFEEQFQLRYQNCGFIFNDVTGVLDAELLSLLKDKRQQENFFYLYSFTHIPSRDCVLGHMNYVKEGDIVQMCFEDFSKSFLTFKENGFRDKIIFDPSFGFSKSYDQNWDLINRMDELVIKLKGQKINTPWLIGISKKSFLRQALIHSIDPFHDSEVLHAKIIKDLLSKQLGHLLFRVHDPELVQISMRSPYA